MIPYGKQSIDEQDIQAVIEVLRSDWLTTGPKVAEFEDVFCRLTGTKHAVAVNSGTAALHSAVYACGIGPGDEVIVPPITFAATANCVVYQGGTPIFVDVDPQTLLIDPARIEDKISPRTKAIIAVDYAGQPCDYDAIKKIAERHNLYFIADACHSLGAKYKDKNIGTLANLNVFSFHPVKHITTGEGGMITTDSAKLAENMMIFRNHGISSDHHQRAIKGSWYYEMIDLGYNYRITDFQCALGISQLKKLSGFINRRQEIACRYNAGFSEVPHIVPLFVNPDVSHAYHLYVIKVDLKALKTDRGILFQLLRENGIGVNVHYIPVHLHPFYQKKFNTGPGLCPIAEAAYEQIISLPIFPKMTDREIELVIESVSETIYKLS